MTNAPHTIRLRGPWKYEVLAKWIRQNKQWTHATDEKRLTSGVVRFPIDEHVFGVDFRGKVLFIRGFNLPTNLTEADRVVLLVKHMNGQAVIDLNGHRVGEGTMETCPHRYNITPYLQPRNELKITVDRPCGDEETQPDKPATFGELLGEVCLEIYAYGALISE